MENDGRNSPLFFRTSSSSNRRQSRGGTPSTKKKMSIGEFISQLSQSTRDDDVAKEINSNWMETNVISSPSRNSPIKNHHNTSPRTDSKTITPMQQPSYTSQTASSSTKQNFNAAKRLQKVQNTKRIIENHKKQLVVEKNKLKKVYEHTVDELNSERRQHEIMQHKLKQITLDLQNTRHENSILRAKLRKLNNETNSWKKQALQVTTSLQQHVNRLKDENGELALQNDLLKDSYEETLKSRKEVEQIKVAYKELQMKHIDAHKDHISNEENTEKFYKKYKHINYLYELEKLERKKSAANAQDMQNKFNTSSEIIRNLRRDLNILKQSKHDDSIKYQSEFRQMKKKLQKMNEGENNILTKLKSKSKLLQRLWANIETCKTSNEAFALIERITCQVTGSQKCTLYLNRSNYSSNDDEKNSKTRVYRPWDSEMGTDTNDEEIVGMGFIQDAMLTGVNIMCDSVRKDRRYNLTSSTMDVLQTDATGMNDVALLSMKFL